MAQVLRFEGLMTELSVGAVLLHQLDEMKTSATAIAGLVRSLAVEADRLEVLVDGFGRVLWYGNSGLPRHISSETVRCNEPDGYRIPFDPQFASRRFNTAATLGGLVLTCQSLFERNPRALHWVRLAMHLGRLEQSTHGFAFWLSVDPQRLTRPLTEGLPEFPWDWNCGEDVRVFHSYPDDLLCLRWHPSLTTIPGARSLQLFSLDDLAVS